MECLYYLSSFNCVCVCGPSKPYVMGNKWPYFGPHEEKLINQIKIIQYKVVYKSLSMESPH